MDITQGHKDNFGGKVWSRLISKNSENVKCHLSIIHNCPISLQFVKANAAIDRGEKQRRGGWEREIPEGFGLELGSDSVVSSPRIRVFALSTSSLAQIWSQFAPVLILVRSHLLAVDLVSICLPSPAHLPLLSSFLSPKSSFLLIPHRPFRIPPHY